MIARELGLTQAAVSLALRNSPRIPAETRSRVRETAARLGYQPNAYVSSLMTHIRSGRPVADKGCIAILMDSKSFDDVPKPALDTYRRQYQGMVRRAELLGFQTECFYLRAPNMSPRKIDRILAARGIAGLVLAAPCRMSEPLKIEWSRYACATVAYTWQGIEIDRVCTHHRNQVDVAFQELLRRGYKRIGVCLPPMPLHDNDAAWMDRYLHWQYLLKEHQPVPLFIGRPGDVPASQFGDWLDKWKIDVVLGLIGHEMEWLNELGLRAPEDIGLACLNRPRQSSFAGVEENHEIIGETTVTLVANQVLHNEHGLPAHPKLILIKGLWREGGTLRKAPDNLPEFHLGHG